MQKMDHEKSDEYTEFLCSLGLAGLDAESNRLTTNQTNLTELSQELALNYYPSFIATNECVKNLLSDLSEVQDESEELVQNIPKFCDSIANFADESKTITKQWREASRMLQKHSTLLEFLEIPQMMETSLRTCNYDEVLRLDSYVRKLRAKYGPGITYLEDVISETNRVRDAMAIQLTKELRSALQLPTCIKVVGHLRQLDKYTGMELRIKFLTVRDLYLQSLVKDIPASPPLFHLTRSIEIFRINLFDIATQYRAVFSSDDPHNFHQHSTESNVLSSWILTKVEHFFKILESDIVACIENETYFPYDSIIDPCYYFGLSMARIGYAMKQRLDSVFQRMCLKRFRLSLDLAEKSFQESLNSYSLHDHLSFLTKHVNVTTQLSLISEISPLKWLLNGILMAFNDIRLISAPSMGFQVTDVLNKSLIRSTEFLLAYCRKQSETAANLSGLQVLCSRFLVILIPHVKSSLEKLFPPSLLAKTMGLSPLELKKAIDDPNETIIRRFEAELLSNLLKDFVKDHENVEHETELMFRELEEEMLFTERVEVKSSSSLDPDLEEGKNEFKEGSDCEEGDDKGVTSSGLGDDKKSQEIMTLEQIK